MAHNNNEENQEYQGISKPAAAFGQGAVTGAKMGALGAGLGAAAGAFMHNKEAHELTDSTYNILDNISISGPKDTKALKETSKELWHSFGRGRKSAAAALVTAVGAGTIGAVVGLVRGAKKTTAAREQFDQLTVDNKELNDKLAASEKSLADVKSTVAVMGKHSEKSHVAELENRRAKSASREAGIA